MTTRELIYAADLLIATSWEFTPEEFAERLAAFVAESTDKLAALRVVCRAYEGKADALKAEAATYSKAAKVAGNRAEAITDLAAKLTRAAIEIGEPLAGAKFVGNGGKAPLVYAPDFDAAKLPTALQRVSIEPHADAIRTAIEGGAEVAGVHIGERGERLKWTEEPAKGAK